MLAAHDASAPATFFSLVRDPLEKLVSAVGEMDFRGTTRWSPGPLGPDTLGKVLASIRSRGFYNEHLWPSTFFLLDAQVRAENRRAPSAAPAPYAPNCIHYSLAASCMLTTY